ncbi:peptidoglycan-binding domain-containing protein [Lentibacillus sp. Marseille-P4043]|uniref:peptidoglycan-binding domain-containing protein n=1 Tax=Lentibacillus sp. Marseille-P4043 TaxID=2040293 RepID=UPI000D0B6105|nr:peptidoglycan-binding domain-containing protein [Lentibacillus sp. Marseille-P4043]
MNATGTFDNKTDTAVRLFQEQHGLTVDGNVGPKTSNKLLEGFIRNAAAARIRKSAMLKLD